MNHYIVILEKEYLGLIGFDVEAPDLDGAVKIAMKDAFTTFPGSKFRIVEVRQPITEEE